MAIDSTSGKEGELGTFLAEYLSQAGYTVEEQPLPGEPKDGRRNIFAHLGEPRVVLSTHMDCVPPFIAPSETDTHILGRGACDAKGVMAAMLCSGEALRRHSRDFGFLFVVGEETDSSGAKHFAKTGVGRKIRYLIDGEPTDNQLMHGHKGVMALKVERHGVPGHSAYAELFHSALHPLLKELAALIGRPLPSDPRFGDSTVNVGVVHGGAAANVVAEHACALVMVRLGRPLAEIKPLVLSSFSPETEVTILSEADPADIYVPPGYDSDVVRFGSDVPHLRAVATPLLVGPGSIHVAHTALERLAKDEQVAAVGLYEKLVLQLLEEPQ